MSCFFRLTALRLAVPFSLSLALLGGCSSREARAKNRYYDSYYHPEGTPIPAQALSP